jgi:hypothetical protein
LLPNLDRRTAAARRFKDIIGAVLADQGGPDRCSESRLQLARRLAGVAVLAEGLESRLANGEDISIPDYTGLCNALARLTQRLGINRIAKDISPTLSQYLSQAEPAE